MFRRTVPALLITLTLGAAACGSGSTDHADLAAAERPGGAPTTTTSTAPDVADDASSTVTAVPPGPTPPETGVVTSGPHSHDAVPEEPTVPGVPGPQADAAGAVRAWVQALADGDAATAWARTHVASRDRFGGQATFDAVEAGRAEGYHAWAGATDDTYHVVTLPSVGPGVSVAVLTGTVAMEGGTAEITDAIPVRMDADGYSQVDPFQDLLAGRDLQYLPDPGTIGRSHTFEVYAVAGRNITLLVDDEVLATTVESADGDQQRVTGAPVDTLAPGAHAFTVVVELHGAVQARSVLYTVTD